MESNILDIDKVLKEKANKTYKFIPKFIINKIKQIVHQDEMNEFVKQNQHYFGQDFLRQLLKRFNLTIKYDGIEKIPKNSNYVFAANHPLGGLDGVALLHFLYNFFGETKAIVNDLLLYVENLKTVFVGVNVFGKFSKNQIEKVEDLYESNTNILVFPAGIVSRKIKGVIQDLEWRKSFLTKAIQHKKNIVPVNIIARNSNFFYNFANFRKKIGLKINLELFYLPDEMFKFSNKTIVFQFGEPISYNLFTKENKIDFWVNYIRTKSEELKYLDSSNQKKFNY